METKVNYAAIGLFVVGLGAVLVAVVLWLASGGTFQKQYDLYAAMLNESVAGLNVNAPVKFNGVDVGKVSRIRLDPADPGRVQLLFAIETGTPIKTDTVAVLKTQGLTGIAYVELSGSSPEASRLVAAPGHRFPVIRTKPSLSARLENVLTTVLAKLDSTSNNINALLSDENRAAFSNTLSSLAAVTQTLAANRQALGAGISSAARTFDNGVRVTEQLGPVIDRIGRGADALERMGNEAALASASAGRTVDAVGADVRRFTADTLPEVERLLGEINTLASSLRRLSEKIEGSPGGLLLGRRPVPPGPGEEAAKGAPR